MSQTTQVQEKCTLMYIQIYTYNGLRSLSGYFKELHDILKGKWVNKSSTA